MSFDPDIAGQRRHALELVQRACARLKQPDLSDADELAVVRRLQHAYRRADEMGFTKDLHLAMQANGFGVTE